MSDENDDSDESRQPPSKVLYQNHQWAVTDYGVESVKPAPTYHFNAERLLEAAGAGMGKLYDWPVHMAEKSWVSIDAFNDAFVKAIEIHAGRYEGKVDQAKLTASIAKSRDEARRR
jgi:hypothetical protein